MYRLLLLALLVPVLAVAGPLRYPELPPLRRPPRDATNPPTPARRNLGAELFFDNRLSGSGFTACNNCHVYNTNWQDNLVKPRPDTSQGTEFFTLPSNTESLLNIVFRPFFFRDGRTEDIAHAFTEPWIEDNQQLGKTRGSAAAHLARLLRARPGYVARFRRAFRQDIVTLDDEAVFDLSGKALAVFARQLVTRDAPFDRWNQGRGSIPEAAEKGVALFVGKAGCVGCHTGPNFSDGLFHNVSTSPPGPGGARADEGRARVTGKPEDGGKFLTPTLRQVVTTSPYFHDGAAGTLADVINHLDTQSGVDPNHDPLVGPPLGLTAEEKLQLYALLKTLRGPPVVVRGPTGKLCDDAAVEALRAHLPR
ncbi:MAG: cytochrome-c peroxidase [Candidatus Binatia bacterium]